MPMVRREAEQSMKINITDQIVSQFLSGLIAVLVVIAVGAFLSFILRGMSRRFPFTRVALLLALAPLSLVNFLGKSESTALIFYAMITTLLGIAIDGLNHLLTPKARTESAQEPVREEQKEEAAEPRPGVIVWEKAE